MKMQIESGERVEVDTPATTFSSAAVAVSKMVKNTEGWSPRKEYMVSVVMAGGEVSEISYRTVKGEWVTLVNIHPTEIEASKLGLLMPDDFEKPPAPTEPVQ